MVRTRDVFRKSGTDLKGAMKKDYSVAKKKIKAVAIKTRDSAKEQSKKVMRMSENTIKRNPKKSVAIAAGVGVATAMATGSFRRRHKK